MPSQNHHETPNEGFSLENDANVFKARAERARSQRAWLVGFVLASIVLAVVAIFMPTLLLPIVLGLGSLGLAYGAYRTAQYFGLFQQTSTAPTNTATTPPVETHEEKKSSVHSQEFRALTPEGEALLAELLDKIPAVEAHESARIIVLEKTQESTANRYRTLFDDPPTIHSDEESDEESDEINATWRYNDGTTP